MPIPRTETKYFETFYTDTLIYKFGGFVELNSFENTTPEIKSIYFETTPCFGSCPIFSLNIFKDGESFYLRHDNLEEKEANFKAKISPADFKQIIDLLKYINVMNLEGNYSVNATDMQTSKLTVYYANGSTKEINDYGLQGTLGLVRLYDLFFALRLIQKWK